MRRSNGSTGPPIIGCWSRRRYPARRRRRALLCDSRHQRWGGKTHTPAPARNGARFTSTPKPVSGYAAKACGTDTVSWATVIRTVTCQLRLDGFSGPRRMTRRVAASTVSERCRIPDRPRCSRWSARQQTTTQPTLAASATPVVVCRTRSSAAEMRERCWNTARSTLRHAT